MGAQKPPIFPVLANGRGVEAIDQLSQNTSTDHSIDGLAGVMCLRVGVGFGCRETMTNNFLATRSSIL
jgi:hypothetical protein